LVSSDSVCFACWIVPTGRSLSAHRAPDLYGSIYKVLIRTAESETPDLPAPKRTNLPLSHGLAFWI